jgi:serine protease Do
MENIMANRLVAAIRIGAALAIFAACPVGVAPAATIDITTAVSASDFGASLGGAIPREERSSDETASLANAVDSAKPAVISVRAKRLVAAGGGERTATAPRDEQHGGAFPGRRAISVGSGFFVTADGYAVTNNHVIEGSETVQIIADDQKTYKAKLVGADPATDIALLKVEGRSDFASVNSPTSRRVSAIEYLQLAIRMGSAVWLPVESFRRASALLRQATVPLLRRNTPSGRTATRT